MNARKFQMRTVVTAVISVLMISFGIWLYQKSMHPVKSKATVVKELKAPEIARFPASTFGQSAMRGKRILENTHEVLPQYVGARMSCTNCHINSGTTPNSGPWVGITARFPQYRARSGKMDSLADRVNDCFERSLNGKRLAVDSPEMMDILAFMQWLSQGFNSGEDVKGSGMPRLKLPDLPDMNNGRKVYAAKCVACHMPDGGGLVASGKSVFPPLWGNQSFNIGAGMARLHTAAGFIKHNMPQGQGGTLTDKEAWDVAAFVIQQPRPDFPRKNLDWPKGDKPEDARY